MTVEKDLTVPNNIYLGFYYQQLWENILASDFPNGKLTPVTLERGLSQTYISNFYSLISNEYSVPPKFWYPLLKINGLDNSLNYDGKTTIYLINGDYLDTKYDLIKLDMESKRKKGMIE